MRFRAFHNDGFLDAIGDDKGHAGREQDVLRPHFDREFNLVAMDQRLALHRRYGVRQRRRCRGQPAQAEDQSNVYTWDVDPYDHWL